MRRTTSAATRRAWTLPALLVICGAALATEQFLTGTPVGAAVSLVAFVLLAAVCSPLIFPRSIGAQEAEHRSAADGHPIVYWRPGCQYCIRLRLRLGRTAHRLHWVNIWQDPTGAAAVRATNDGNETVPTVVIAGRAYTNPEPGWVREQLPPAT